MAKRSTVAQDSKRASGTVSTRQGIVVLDFGGQYTQLIARRIREQEVFSAILPCTASLEEIRKARAGRASCCRAARVRFTTRARRCAIPNMLQSRRAGAGNLLRHAMAHAYAGRKSGAGRAARIWPGAARYRKRVRRYFTAFPTQSENLEQPWRSRGRVARGFRVTGRTDNAVAAVENAAKKLYGVQFHPEVNHTDRGTEILRNFVFEICGAKKNWNRAGFHRRDRGIHPASRRKARGRFAR